MYKIVHEPPEFTDQLKAQLSPPVVSVLEKALEKDPQKRYRTCTLLTADLKRSQILTTNPSTTPSTRPVPSPVAPPPLPFPDELELKSPHSSRQQLILKVLLLIVVIGVAATWAMRTFFKSAPPPVETQAETKAVKDAADEILRGRTSLPAVVNTTEFTVNSNVDGSRVFVDGKTRPQWVTPARLELEPGTHRVEVRKAGYKSQVQILVFNLNSGPQFKYFELEQATEESTPTQPH
jgi:serine/threonine protein kinase